MTQAPTLFPTSGKKRISVAQGELCVSADPMVELGAILGSCVSACLHDPKARLGGMNHFLLASNPAGSLEGQASGASMMQRLIDELVMIGASRTNLVARLFGGSDMTYSSRNVGHENAECARQILHEEGITILSEDLGEKMARHVLFYPASGEFKCRKTSISSPSANAGTFRLIGSEFGHSEPKE